MLSIPHLVVIFIVVLVIFGPEKIPELARNFGKVMAEFRRVTGDLRSTFEGHLRDLEHEAEQRRIAGPVAVPSPAASAAAPTAETPPSTAALGTVPSNPPNAAAVVGPPGPTSDPPDPMHDPYLMNSDFPPRESSDESARSAESEPKPERVINGDGRAS